jgi:hypothetical protein
MYSIPDIKLIIYIFVVGLKVLSLVQYIHRSALDIHPVAIYHINTEKVLPSTTAKFYPPSPWHNIPSGPRPSHCRVFTITLI